MTDGARPPGGQEPLVLRKRQAPDAAAPDAAAPATPAGQVNGLTTTLPPEASRQATVPPERGLQGRTPTLPLEAVRGEVHGKGARASRGASATAGLVATAGIHVTLVLAVLLVGGREKREPPPKPKEMIIETHILEVQAGSPEGMRETGPAYRRRRAGPRPPARRPQRELHLGTSGRRGPRRPAMRGPTAPPDPGKDDAADVPGDWGSQKGVDAPPGAQPSDDRRGAGGTAEKGALDPCFTQHAQVVAGYRAQVSGKIPAMPRPAFITADVAENLSTLVRVAIDASGKIVSVGTAKSSGNPRFDGGAVSHVQAIGSFPAPHKCVMYDKLKGIFRPSVTFTVSVRAR